MKQKLSVLLAKGSPVTRRQPTGEAPPSEQDWIKADSDAVCKKVTSSKNAKASSVSTIQRRSCSKLINFQQLPLYLHSNNKPPSIFFPLIFLHFLIFSPLGSSPRLILHFNISSASLPGPGFSSGAMRQFWETDCVRRCHGLSSPS